MQNKVIQRAQSIPRRWLVAIAGAVVVLLFLASAQPTNRLVAPTSQQATAPEIHELPSDSSRPVLSQELDKDDSCSWGRTASRTKQNAIVTFLSSDSYLLGAQILAYSLKQFNTVTPLVLVYPEGSLSEAVLCKARAAGWQPRSVPLLENPPGKGPPENYKDQFTKLRLWTMEEYGQMVLIDSDAYAYRPIEKLFCLDVEFATANNFFYGFNAGMMYFRPSMARFNDFKEKMQNTSAYDINYAEQAFLTSYFFTRDHVRLPYSWNVDLNTYLNVQEWKEVWPQAKIIHFTRHKPWTVRDDPVRNEEPWKRWFELEEKFLADPSVNGAHCPK